MPYIENADRPLAAEIPSSPGELNYAITCLVEGYIGLVVNEQEINAPVNYQLINDVLGALEGAKMEFYRRVAGPYEETKIVENGDIPLYENTHVWAGRRLMRWAGFGQ